MKNKEFKLQKIELYNIFNYKGRHCIDFKTESNGNIFLFDIKNGGGKTSLFLSIKWGFYGFDGGIKYEKDSIILTPNDFINQDERDAGIFYVEISFLYDDVAMILKRECTNYLNNVTELTLRIGDEVLSGNEAKEYLLQIIPPDYGDFFMFNGEVLSDMAINQKNKEKMEGVLKLLGLKQLSDLRDSLDSVKNSLENDFYNGMSTSSVSSIENEIKEKRESLSKLESDLKTICDTRDNLQSRILELESNRRALSNIEEMDNKLRGLSARKRELEGLITGTISSIEKNSSNTFLLFIHNDLKDLIKKIDEERKVIIKKQHTSHGIENEYSHIQNKILVNHLAYCPVCKSNISQDLIAELQEIALKSENASEEFENDKKRLMYLNDIRGIVEYCYDDEPVKLDEFCSSLFKYTEEKNKIDSDIIKINELLSQSEIDSVREISESLVGLYKDKSNEDTKYNKLSRMQSAGKIKLDKLTSDYKKQKKLSDLENRNSNRITFVKNLLNNIDSVISRIKHQKRDDILARANDVFMSVTNKSDVYNGLAYDDNRSFSMHIVRKDGQTVIHPSSGEKHVLAISFLVSLSLNTERMTPMMMDTPLSRLDVEHKKNIGTMLSKLGNQVLFLAQPGELDDETRKSLMPSVAKMYESRPTEDNTASIVEVDI